MTPKAKYYETLANTMIKNFEKRRMEAYYCPTAKEAVEKALSFLPSGAVVAHGGSMTLEETGMMDALRSADIQFLDRAVCKTPEVIIKKEILRWLRVRGRCGRTGKRARKRIIWV